jgi:ADP-ribose pyrophosphatase
MSDIEKQSESILEPWLILNEHDEINNRWLRIRNVTYRLPNDQVISDYYLAEKSSVVVIIPIKNDETFLIHEFERGVNEVGHKFPSGRVDPGEEPNQAASRELLEELGLKANKLVFLGDAYVDPGFMTNRAYYYIGFDLEDIPDGKLNDPCELFSGTWVKFEGIQTMIEENEIKNPFVVVGYSLASAYIKRQDS